MSEIFTTKSFSDIAAGMVAFARVTGTQITDFNVGSVARTLLESASIELEDYYQAAYQGLLRAIPEAVFNSFDFPDLAAAKTTGTVTLTITVQASDVTVLAGTVLTANDLASTPFTVTADATIATGDTTGTLLVEAVTAGYAGNIALSSTFTANPTITGFVSAEATTGFINGRDAETLDERRARFREYIAALPRGTVAALQYGASTAVLYDENGYIQEQVQQSLVVEPYLTDPAQPPGLIELYIYSGVTYEGTPLKGCTADLLALVADIVDGYYADDGTPIPGWKAAGTKVEYYACDLVAVNIEAEITIAEGYTVIDVLSAVETAIETYLNALPMGGDAVVAELIASAMGVPGVTDVAVTEPATNTPIAATEKAVIGTVAISQGE